MIPPGKKIAEIKQAVKDAILDGEVENNHEADWKFVEERYGGPDASQRQADMKE